MTAQRSRVRTAAEKASLKVRWGEVEGAQTAAVAWPAQWCPRGECRRAAADCGPRNWATILAVASKGDPAAKEHLRLEQARV
mmetsp:Transcript_169728/g.544705  ORF Transcript_169728/g.544705 Transcript_169728/m.544705 type:complete len:82 (-) Transcript_169728:1167-1412(-)|eukprot:CAMPEP_0204205414 /NCGR_PEP_ID=MMETSP0361-20130328/70313_1 /ASSEMBLY_ACC=CAM_ASM_000343 /TAXON_ID=268821 /ORGANISM="Scrippsiella Hangoei, Strain SHTV-5" /LENGTH=81 /DNA_ID=CAMNT_0051168659 /DNA_START=127 /DNA_END=372 /DNA_ORIENTATION=+